MFIGYTKARLCPGFSVLDIHVQFALDVQQVQLLMKQPAFQRIVKANLYPITILLEQYLIYVTLLHL